MVFCPDPPGYGERAETGGSSLDSSCRDLSQTSEALGLSLTALEIWELQRLLDFACHTPYLAADESGPRIGCVGFSGGGRSCMWLATMDDRIRLAVVSGYVHGYFDSILSCHFCPCNFAPRLWTLGDISDICSLIAPRPLFIENGIQDGNNGPRGIEGPKEQVKKIREAYELLGKSELLIHNMPEGGHKWYGECYQFLDENL